MGIQLIQNSYIENMSMKMLDELQPDWIAAELHGKATSVGIPANKQNHLLQGEKCLCECCNNIIQKSSISLCKNSKELQFLGIGFPLYFVFLKYCIILLLIQSLTSSFMSLYWANKSNYTFCIENEKKLIPHTTEQISCSSVMVQIARVQDQVSWEELILRLGSFSIHLLFLIYLRDKLPKLNEYYDQRSTTYSDYAIIIDKLPPKTGLKADIIQLLSGYKLHQIVLIGNFDEFYHLKEYKDKIIQQKKNLYQIKAKSQEEQFLLNVQNQRIQKQLTEIKKRIGNLLHDEKLKYNNDEVIAEKAILCLQTDEQKEQIIQKFTKNSQITYPAGWDGRNKIKVNEAPEPKEILWENINITLSKRIKYQLIGWLITIFLLLIVSVIFYLILKGVSNIIKSQVQAHTQGKANFIAYLSFLFVILFNKFVITYVFHKVVHYQKYPTKSKEQLSFSLKYLLGQFFTTALMTLLVEDFTNHNIYSERFGLVQTETIMMFLSAFLIPLIWLVNPWAIYSTLLQQYYIGKKNLTQLEANQIMEKTSYMLGKRYAEILKVLWLVFLYQSLIPLGIPLATLGLTLYYWIDKYNLIHRSSVTQNVSGFLTLKVLKLLDLTLFLKPVGEIIFDLQIRYNYSIVSFVCLGIGCLYLVLPVNQFIKLLHPQVFNKQYKSFIDAKENLPQSYQQLHPILGQKFQQYSQTSKEQVSFQSIREQYKRNQIFKMNRTILSQLNALWGNKIQMRQDKSDVFKEMTDKILIQKLEDSQNINQDL